MSPNVPSESDRAGQKQRLTALDGALALISVLLIVQVWLLTAALEALLAGHPETAIPAAVASAALFGGVFGLYRFTSRLDGKATGS